MAEAEPTTAATPATWPSRQRLAWGRFSCSRLLPLVTLLPQNTTARAHDEHRAPASYSVSLETQTTETGPRSRDSQASGQPQQTAP